MVRVFITGSSDGIGLAIAQTLSKKGHQVTLHARSAARAEQTAAKVPNAQDVLVGDLSSITETKNLAASANSKGPFDVVIHNAGIGYGGTSSHEITADGISAVFAVNTLAPYMLTSLMSRPARLLFMSSDSHYSGDASLRDCTISHSYGNSKLHDVMLARAFARRWSEVQSVSMHPGWVRTKMGGNAAPGSTDVPADLLAEWAAGEGWAAKLESGSFFTTRGKETAHSGAADVEKQEELMGICKKLSGVGV